MGRVPRRAGRTFYLPFAWATARFKSRRSAGRFKSEALWMLTCRNFFPVPSSKSSGSDNSVPRMKKILTYAFWGEIEKIASIVFPVVPYQVLLQPK